MDLRLEKERAEVRRQLRELGIHEQALPTGAHVGVGYVLLRVADMAEILEMLDPTRKEMFGLRRQNDQLQAKIQELKRDLHSATFREDMG